jgi:signal transduction histidine kinase
MRRWWGRADSLLGDAVIAPVALGIALSAMFIAGSTGWMPDNPADYLTVAFASAGVWLLARVAPRSTLVAAAIVVSWPWWWWWDSPEMRMLPLLIAALRAALLGVPPLFVALVSLVPSAVILYPGLWVSTHLTFVYGTWGWTITSNPSLRILTVAVFIVIVTLGYLIRAHRRVAEQLRRQHAELVELRASDEERIAERVRTAAAHDIHDLVAHHVSAMVVRAQAAHPSASAGAARVDGALQAIIGEGSEALTAMRRLVRMMRGMDGAEDAVGLADAVQRMADPLRAAGVSVSVDIDASDADRRIDGAIAGIVQEALTNVMIHADARHVSVAVHRGVDALEVVVADDGTGGAAAVVAGLGGHGIDGMRARASALGGELTAGPGLSRGWQVVGRVPARGRTETP